MAKRRFAPESDLWDSKRVRQRPSNNPHDDDSGDSGGNNPHDGSDDADWGPWKADRPEQDSKRVRQLPSNNPHDDDNGDNGGNNPHDYAKVLGPSDSPWPKDSGCYNLFVHKCKGTCSVKLVLGNDPTIYPSCARACCLSPSHVQPCYCDRCYQIVNTIGGPAALVGYPPATSTSKRPLATPP